LGAGLVEGMIVSIEWHDGEITSGESASEVFEKLLPGWNPPTVPELKATLARRGRITPPNNEETDEQFLARLDKCGMLVLKTHE
jgi:hypothetical protein